MKIFGETRQNRREYNEDSFQFFSINVQNGNTINVFVVADGVGSLQRSQEVAQKAILLYINEIMDTVCGTEFCSSLSLDSSYQLLERMNAEILLLINENLIKSYPELQNQIGTTITGAVLYQEKLFVSNCGDSPAYLIRGNRNTILSLIVTDRIDKNNRNSSEISQCLGFSGISPHNTVIDVEKNDILLFGSDGAFGDITDNELMKIVCSSQPSNTIAGNVLKIAQRNTLDNQTIIVADLSDTYGKKRRLFSGSLAR